ncbi:hypothetical protein PGT21_011868 [Puccinia graminis f. sp. tritici]|uniref:Uncharacterized protein n=1 Tax=Puccinia graminis f. sp. tritici TaxID=56615 RepID=A0A5B0MH41_PUCGR|nr:hypothetical protein PGT21_011868 [Puccinia graminis f. sp. tritici]
MNWLVGVKGGALIGLRQISRARKSAANYVLGGTCSASLHTSSRADHDYSCLHDEQENAKRKACDLNHDVNDDMNSVNDKSVSLNSESFVRHSNYQIVNTYTTKLADRILPSILAKRTARDQRRLY